jgi:signal transduction histidine kinase
MPEHSPLIPTPDSQNFATAVKSRWLDWPPVAVGLLVAMAFAVPALAVIWNVNRRATHLLEDSIRSQLLAAARSVAAVSDPALHGTLRSPEQAGQPEYLEAIRALDQMKSALDVKGMIRYVYTCVLEGGKVCFVLDPTPEGDADHDGLNDRAGIMEVYEGASHTLNRVLQTGVPEVDASPYTDRWGTFLSGYAPIRGSTGNVVAVAGVDMALTDYDLQLSGVWHVSYLSSLGALSLAMVAGVLMGAYHRRLQRSVGQLVVARDAALESSRAKSQFLAAMSHELRTPMNAVLGMGELLADTPLTADQSEFVATIRKSGESLLEMITDILDCSQLDSGRIELNPSPLVLQGMVDALQAQFGPIAMKKGVSLGVFVSPEPLPTINVDGMRLRQMLRHLLSNAVKFTDRGEIQMKLTITPENRLQVVVQDTGIGISAERQETLLKSLLPADFSNTRRHGGVGLGLGLCQRLVTLMGGRLWLKSEEGKGCCFSIDLPVEVVVPKTPKSALLITGDRMTVIVVKSFLEKHGFNVGHASTVDGAREILVGNSPQLVLADLQLLGVTELCADHPGDSRWIGLNADSEERAQAGCDLTLPSPATPTDLKKLI